jgi:hypothetical protein
MTDLLNIYDNSFSLNGDAPQTPRLRASSLLGLEVVGEARGWLNTPFRHQGRVKGVGVDCLGLLVGVAAALDLRSKTGERLADFDVLGYGHYPNAAQLRAVLESALEPLAAPQAGSIGIFEIDGSAQHLGIFGNQESGIENQESSRFPISDSRFLTLIHAYAPARKVVEHGLTTEWKARLVAVYGACKNGDNAL